MFDKWTQTMFVFFFEDFLHVTGFVFDTAKEIFFRIAERSTEKNVLKRYRIGKQIIG